MPRHRFVLYGVRYIKTVVEQLQGWGTRLVPFRPLFCAMGGKVDFVYLIATMLSRDGIVVIKFTKSRKCRATVVIKLLQGRRGGTPPRHLSLPVLGTARRHVS